MNKLKRILEIGVVFFGGWFDLICGIVGAVEKEPLTSAQTPDEK
jgi:hypothetical protein